MYALRRTLPVWSFQENLAELVTCLPKYGVDELIVKVDTEEFTHGQPPLEWVRAYQPKLFRVKEALEKLGIIYSLNPWITVGHNDRGRHAKDMIPTLQTMVGHNGTECICCACPLSEAWREHIRKVWALYAQTQPNVIWIEDDIRTFNHEPLKYGCFCPIHLKRLSEKLGATVTREALVAAMLVPGKPHPWRTAYLQMQTEVMNETARFLAEVVHAISPETSLGLMSSGPRQHCLEGRDWQRFGAALANGRVLYSRPPMGNYVEDHLRGFYYSHDSIKLTRHCLQEGVVEQTEVESAPFTRYTKSTVFTFLEIAVSFAYGSHGVTMNLFDHCGTPMEHEPWYGRMLREKKPFLKGLSAEAAKPGTFAGVQLLHHDHFSFHKKLNPNAAYQDLAEDGYQMMELLEVHGIATTYAESNLIATSGQQLRAFSDDQIHNMFAKGMFIDATAACVLFERGFGELIGLKSIEPPMPVDDLPRHLLPLAAEEFHNPDFGGQDKCFLTLITPNCMFRPSMSQMTLAAGTQLISEVVNPDAKRMAPCMYAFENSLGGRVIVHALDLASAWGAAFMHPHRAMQLRGVFRWLGHNHVPLITDGGVYPLSFRKECDDGTMLLGLFNLNLDPWESANFHCADLPKTDRWEILQPSGEWLPSEALKVNQNGTITTIRYENPVSFDAPLFIRAHRKG